MRRARPGTDRWGAERHADRQGAWTFAVEAWSDPFATWRHDAEIKIAAGHRRRADARGGRAAARAGGQGVAPQRRRKRDAARRGCRAARHGAARSTARLAARRAAPRSRRAAPRIRCATCVTSDASRTPLWVDRERALYGAWYEFFPRSEGADADRPAWPRPAPSRTAAERLPAVAAMGFDVVYLPPIHPIGTTNRKGPNNTLDAGPGRRRVAVGDRLAETAATTPSTPTSARSTTSTPSSPRPRELGLEVALDFALQCSPDHPWVTEHPEWFTTGPTARSPTPRTRRRSTRTSTRSTSTTTPRASTPRSLRVLRLLDGPRRPHLPGRQPAHQAGRRSGSGCSPRSARPTPT